MAIRNISPLAWLLGISAVANVITMAAVLYIALGSRTVYVGGGYISADIDQIKNRGEPVRVQVVP